MTNTRNTPIESIGRAFVLRVLRYRLRARPPGPRRCHRLADHRATGVAAACLAAGRPGATGENWLLPSGAEGRAERLPDQRTIRLMAGDVLRRLIPGGDGWGMPPDPRSS